MKKTILLFVLNLLSNQAFASQTLYVQCDSPNNSTSGLVAEIKGELQFDGTENPNGAKNLLGALAIELKNTSLIDFSNPTVSVKGFIMPNGSVHLYPSSSELYLIFIMDKLSYVEVGNRSYATECEVI